jgi:CIC family chloride channel protein
LAQRLPRLSSPVAAAPWVLYGPLVHFGSTVGLLFKRLLFKRLDNDVLIGCGVAAAISAGFSAPLAGVIFAHEAILRHFSLRAIAPIFIASISASAFSDFFFGQTENIFNLSQTVPPLSQIIPYIHRFRDLFFHLLPSHSWYR